MWQQHCTSHGVLVTEHPKLCTAKELRRKCAGGNANSELRTRHINKLLYNTFQPAGVVQVTRDTPPSQPVWRLAAVALAAAQTAAGPGATEHDIAGKLLVATADFAAQQQQQQKSRMQQRRSSAGMVQLVQAVAAELEAAGITQVDSDTVTAAISGITAGSMATCPPVAAAAAAAAVPPSTAHAAAVPPSTAHAAEADSSTAACRGSQHRSNDSMRSRFSQHASHCPAEADSSTAAGTSQQNSSSLNDSMPSRCSYRAADCPAGARATTYISGNAETLAGSSTSSCTGSCTFVTAHGSDAAAALPGRGGVNRAGAATTVVAAGLLHASRHLGIVAGSTTAAQSLSSSVSSSAVAVARTAAAGNNVASAGRSSAASAAQPLAACPSRFPALQATAAAACSMPAPRESSCSSVGSMHSNRQQWQPASSPAEISAEQQFPLLFELACRDAVEPTNEENYAAQACIDNVVSWLRQEISKMGGLQLALGTGETASATLDRIFIAGSFAKNTHVRGMFDVDLVMYFNVPTQCWGQVIIADPDSTYRADCFRELKRQLHLLLQSATRSSLGMSGLQQKGPAALSFELDASAFGYSSSAISFDLLFAPNLAGDTVHLSLAEVASKQCMAVLQPMLDAAEACSADNMQCLAGASLPRYSSTRSVWVQEAATECLKQAFVVGGDVVVTSTVRLLKAWVRKGLQQESGQRKDYFELKGCALELLTLCAAQQLSQQRCGGAALAGQHCGAPGQHEVDRSSASSLELFQRALQVAQEWASMAEARDAGEDSEPVLLIGSIQQLFYSKEQATALQALLASCSMQQHTWTKGERCFAQPVVLHPVDMMNNVFVARRFGLPMWQLFKQDAATLHQQLELCKSMGVRGWQSICTESTLAGVFGARHASA